ncbi:MAG: dihydroorotate dehydrogenase electron transfer subunit [Bacteroidota bacterium]
MYLVQSVISEIIKVAPGYFRLKLTASAIAAEAKPGQFIQIRVGDELSVDPLLARPISIFRINKAEGTISLLFKVVGKGTTLLASKQKGDVLTIWGPIGNGFEVPEEAGNIALVAGGIGMPPLFCLGEQLSLRKKPPQLTLFYGGRTSKNLLELDLWEKSRVPVKIATEDGSLGWKGFITELFINEHQANGYDFIISCGPAPMLAEVQKIAVLTGLNGQLSLEAHMACGVGACLGCTCQTIHGSRRVCVDGPVFSIKEVIF